jgi:hypothetical protein
MLTMQIPTLLAVLGTVLMGIVIFAPAPVAARVTTSFAPPLPSQSPEQWRAETFSPLHFDDRAIADDLVAPAGESCEPAETIVTWPSLVDPSATGCDAATRLALVDALATVRTGWSDAILRRAWDEEPDELVRDALATLRC